MDVYYVIFHLCVPGDRTDGMEALFKKHPGKVPVSFKPKKFQCKSRFNKVFRPSVQRDEFI